MSNCFVWAKQNGDKKNVGLLFKLNLCFEKSDYADIEISASGTYTFFLQGLETLHGPARAAKGYLRAEKHRFFIDRGNTLFTVLVNDYGVRNYAYVWQQPFFYFKMKINGKTYSASDFSCYQFVPKTRNTQRYSFQRGFTEMYTLDCNYKELFTNTDKYLPPIPIESAEPLKELEHRTPTLVYMPVQKGIKTFCGAYTINPEKKVWKDRSIFLVGNNFEGYTYQQLEECLTDTVGKMFFTKSDNREILTAGTFAFYNFCRNISGFISCNVNVTQDNTQLYLIFDEAVNKDGFVNPTRLNCANVVKWTLKKGEYALQTLEPYTLQFAQLIVVCGEAKPLDVSVRLFENPECYNVTAEIADDKLQRIVKAAQNTQAQNAVDLLMDCPSRERSGWINDIYFSMKSFEMFAGNFHAVKNSLENFALYDDDGELPENMLPMCYPANHLDGNFVPQCAMWYVINLCEYLLKNPDLEMKEKGRNNAYRTVQYFEKYENADGLLEDLPGWNFIEWSKCNSPEYVRGVNYPTNMLYAKMFADMGNVYNDRRLLEKSCLLKEKIIEQSFNGEFFEENCVRDDKGRLRLLGHITETCQYYAFLTKVATKETFPSLYKTLRDCLGPQRKARIWEEVEKPNIIPGVLARETMFLENGESEQVLSEVKDIFFIMAEHYQTLWEMVDDYASCNHGIAAYAGYLIIRALTGFKGYFDGEPIFAEKYANINCKFTFHSVFGVVNVSLKDGKRFWEKI